MLKRLAVVLAALPLFAEAQAPQKPPPAPQSKPAPPPGDDQGIREQRQKQREDRMKDREQRMKEREARHKERAERREQRARLARTLGLAEILDLNEQQALKLREQLANFDTRRERAREQLRGAQETLHRAADADPDGGAGAGARSGAGAEKPVSAAEVDQAIQRMFAARAELEAIDRDTLAALPRDLKPDQRARAAIFLQRFSNRFGPERFSQRKVIRIPGPGMEGMHGFNLDLPDFRFEMHGMPDFEFEHEFHDLDDEEVEGAEDL